MNPQVSFIGFTPEDNVKSINVLQKVIELKHKNRIAAEQYQGLDTSETERYAKKFTPVVNALETAVTTYLQYRSDDDIRAAEREKADALLGYSTNKEAYDNDPNNQGYFDMTILYQYEYDIAVKKIELLKAMKQLQSSEKSDLKLLALAKKVEDMKSEYNEAIAAYSRYPKPAGALPTVAMLTAPPVAPVNPGAAGPTAVQPPPVGIQPPPVGIPPPPAMPPTKSKLRLKWYEQLMRSMRQKGADNKVPNGYNKTENKPPLDGQAYILDDTDPAFSDLGISIIVTSTRGDDSKAITMITDGTEYAIDFTGGANPVSTTDDPELFDAVKALLTDVNKMGWTKKPMGTLMGIIRLHTKLFGGWGKQWLADDSIYDNNILIKKMRSANDYAKAVANSQPPSPTTSTDVVGEGKRRRSAAKTASKSTYHKLGPNGEFGSLMIDMPKLYNEGRLIASHSGRGILDETAQPGLTSLLTKKNVKRILDTLTPQLKKQYLRLGKHADSAAPVVGGLRKRKPTDTVVAQNEVAGGSSGIIVVGSPEEIYERMKVAVGVFNAGNRSKKNKQLISELAQKLVDCGKITKAKYTSILRSLQQ